MVWLIETEKEAVLTENISLIEDIFDEYATIRDVAGGFEWFNPRKRYEELFADADYEGIQHTDLRLLDLSSQVGRFVTGSRGSFRTAGSEPIPFDNRPTSDHWTFGKANGCWVITEFEFNAAHKPFPPPGT
jgi:hypothetical protein